MKHHPKYYISDARTKGGKRVTAYVFSCTPCGINGKLFTSPVARAKFAEDHQNAEG